MEVYGPVRNITMRAPANSNTVWNTVTQRQEDKTSGVDDRARAARIQQLKDSRGWTWQRLAAEVGVELVTAQTWGSPSKAVKPSWPHLAKLAQVFGTTPAWIETGEDTGEPADPVETLRYDVDQLRGRLTQLDQQIRFIAENRDGITRLEAAVEKILALLREQGTALGELLQEQSVAQTEGLAGRRAAEGHAPASGERRTASGRRQNDP